jgi:hypothetical protein
VTGPGDHDRIGIYLQFDDCENKSAHYYWPREYLSDSLTKSPFDITFAYFVFAKSPATHTAAIRTTPAITTSLSVTGYFYPLVGIIGVFVVSSVYAVWQRTKKSHKELGLETLKIEDVKPKMQIEVLDTTTRKLVKLEVESNHTIGSLVETLVDGLNLAKGEYILEVGARKFGRDEYSLTLEKAGIRTGSRLELRKM